MSFKALQADGPRVGGTGEEKKPGGLGHFPDFCQHEKRGNDMAYNMGAGRCLKAINRTGRILRQTGQGVRVQWTSQPPAQPSREPPGWGCTF